MLAVEPVPDASGPPPHPWVCANCGLDQSGVGQWLLHFGVPSASRREVFVICPDCTLALRPVRLCLDVTAFTDLVEERPQLRLVADLARSVLAARGSSGEQMRLRAGDTVVLAEDLTMTQNELVAELYAVGALAV